MADEFDVEREIKEIRDSITRDALRRAYRAGQESIKVSAGGFVALSPADFVKLTDRIRQLEREHELVVGVALDEIATRLTTYPNQVSPIVIELVRNWKKDGAQTLREHDELVAARARKLEVELIGSEYLDSTGWELVCKGDFDKHVAALQAEVERLESEQKAILPLTSETGKLI